MAEAEGWTHYMLIRNINLILTSMMYFWLPVRVKTWYNSGYYSIYTYYLKIIRLQK